MSFAMALAGLALAVGLAVLPFDTVVIIAGALAVLAVIALIFAQPVIGLALTIFLSPFAPLENIMFHLPIDSGQALLILTATALVARTLYRRKADYHSGPLLWPLLLFLTIGFTSFFATQSFELWAKECVKWVEVIAVYVVVVSETRTNPHSRHIMIGAILLSTLFEAALGIYQFGLRGTGPNSFGITGTPFFRAYGTFEQPNPFGGYMGLTWTFSAGIALYTLRKAVAIIRQKSARFSGADVRVFILATGSTLTSLCALVALVLSWSRGAWLGAGVAAVVMMIVALRRPKPTIVAVAGLAAILVAAYAAGLIPDTVVSRLTGFTDELATFDVRHVTVTGANHAVIERLAHWQAAENMIIDKPWFGVGFGNYGAVYDQYRTLNWPLALGHAHNYYLNIFAETGVIGLMAYLFLWTAIIVRTIRTARQSLKLRVATTPKQYDIRLASMVAIGLIGAWMQISVHQVVDNLYVANMFLLVGVYIGLLDGLGHEHAGNRSQQAQFRM